MPNPGDEWAAGDIPPEPEAGKTITMTSKMRADGERAAWQYDEMQGFPGSGYISRLGQELVEGADALQAAERRLSEASTQIMRLPEPQEEQGDGPQERVGHVLALLANARRTVVMVREELVFGGNWKDARDTIDRFLTSLPPEENET